MKKAKKITIIIAICLMLAGIIICTGVLVISDFDFRRLDNSVYTTNNYNFDKEIKNINIDCDTADISILRSTDNSCTLTCYEDEKFPHLVNLQDGTLSIIKAKKHWYDHIKPFSFRKPEITLYLPYEMYDSLIIEADTGNITSDNISATKIECETTTGKINLLNTEYAEFIDAEASTGHITIKNTNCGKLNAEASTGKIILDNVKAMEIEAETNTGDINFINTVAEGNITAEVSTGDIIFEASDGRNIFTETSTGNITGTLLTSKTFNAHSSTGKVSVPKTQASGLFEAKSSTGRIIISYTTSE